jgi:predicted outer membrane protein
MTTRDDIKQINRALQCACESSAVTIEAINRLSQVTQALYKTTLEANWNTTPGNSIDYTYDANNNVTVAEHYEGATLVFTQAFTYDANNNCTNITTT